MLEPSSSSSFKKALPPWPSLSGHPRLVGCGCRSQAAHRSSTREESVEDRRYGGGRPGQRARRGREWETVRRRLLHEYDVHTLLRLPTGIFYAQGVKANVIFFERKPASETPWTTKLRIYDLRTNEHFTLKQNTLSAQALQDLVVRYNPDDRQESGRKRSVSEPSATRSWSAATRRTSTSSGSGTRV